MLKLGDVVIRRKDNTKGTIVEINTIEQLLPNNKKIKNIKYRARIDKEHGFIFYDKNKDRIVTTENDDSKTE